MDNRPRILCDVDGVIADFESMYVELAKQALGRDFPDYDGAQQWLMEKALGLTTAEVEEVHRLLYEPRVANRIRPYPGAVENVKQLTEVAHVYFVTAQLKDSPTWCYDRYEWLRHWFGKELADKTIFTHVKYVCSGEMLIDDKAENVVKWKEHNPTGVAVLWDHPSNKSFKGEVVRSDSWEQIIKWAVSLRRIRPHQSDLRKFINKALR